MHSEQGEQRESFEGAEQCEVCENWLDWNEGFEQDGVVFCSDPCVRVFLGEDCGEPAESWEPEPVLV